MTAKKNWLWPALLLGILLLFGAATIDTQPLLSPDDHGKDLYAFEQFLEGRQPCRDYWWQYGPFMLFYYGFWLKVVGMNLISIRIGVAFLYFLSSFLIYGSLRLFTSRPIAFLASLAVLLQWLVYPYYNFNHLGATPLLLLSLLCLWKFFLSGRWRWAYGGMAALTLLSLLKVNTGLTSFAAFFISLFFAKPPFRPKHLFFLCLIFGAVTAGVYLYMYSGYSLAYVEQCVPFRLELNREQETTLWTNLIHLVQWFWVWDRSRLGWLALFLIFGIFGFLGFRKQAFDSGGRRKILAALGSLVWFEIFNSSDYFSLGHIYRLDFWSFPVLVLGMGLAAHWGAALFNSKTRVALGILIFLGVLGLPLLSVKKAWALKVPERYLDFDRGRVYLIRENSSTVEAVKKGTHFILEHSKPGEEILAVPIAPLYSFLSDRKHASRELYFAEHAPLADWQEERILRRLESGKVPLVILTNLDGQAPGIGKFGETQGLKLGRYIFENYTEAQSFGSPWDAPNPRTSHAIRIYQRGTGSGRTGTENREIGL